MPNNVLEKWVEYLFRKKNTLTPFERIVPNRYEETTRFIEESIACSPVEYLTSPSSIANTNSEDPFCAEDGDA